MSDFSAKQSRPLILLTGATGYVGARLLERLEANGYYVRCMARRPEALPTLGPNTEAIAGDVLDIQSLSHALQGVHTAFYLIHSMDRGDGFEEVDRQSAENFARAAADAGVHRIIYLGGLADESQQLSPHLRSRHEVGETLRSTGVPVIEFRASIVIGSGSLSFEMIRALVERLPVMVAPRWVSVQAQPIAIGDLLSYLQQAIDLSIDGSQTFEIGGADRVSYGDLMREYAQQRGLRRWIIPVPVLTPRLSSLWLALVTPLYARVGRKLIESIRHPSVIQDDSARRAFTVRPLDHKQAIAAALADEDTEWSRSRAKILRTKSPTVGAVRANRLFDTRALQVNRTPEQVFAAVERIGGQAGWYYANWLWHVRGALDLLVGGIGLRRGRLDPARLHLGDTVDCWRVEAIEPAHRLRLAAEMKLPGRAWLEFEIEPHGTTCELRQTAEFDPRGVLGRAYWYAVYPLHQLVFSGMLRGIANSGQEKTNVTTTSATQGPWKRGLMLLFFLFVCFAAAGIGSWWTASSLGTWYQALSKPNWNPPDWIFGPVWSTLYAMMAIAAWLVWMRGAPPAGTRVWTPFAAQLTLNTLWSGLFFGLRQPGWAFAEVILLWLAIAATIEAFRWRSRTAAWLLVPYLAWVTFASVLNFAIWRLNA